jgi:alanine racemase
MQLKNKIYYRSWVEISESALRNNLKVIKSVAKSKVKVICVVKANAYGHGLDEMIHLLEKYDTEMYAVDSIEEGIKIRELDIDKPILILGYVVLSDLKKAVENNISLTIYNLESLKNITSLKLNKRAKVHLKVETGLNRQGVDTVRILNFAKFIRKNRKYLEIEGISTHFADIEDTTNTTFAEKQLTNFKKTITVLEKNGFSIPIKHCAASAAALLYKKTHFNAIRTGISVYGLWPSNLVKKELLKSINRKILLKPVLSWKSRIAQIKKVKKGESVGYGRTWYAKKDSKIAIIPVGYYDGYDRGLSNTGRVIIDGKYADVIGRIAMNMMMADVTEIENVKLEDTVILIGKDKNKEISTDELAAKISTINYEIVTRINPNIPRLLTN